MKERVLQIVIGKKGGSYYLTIINEDFTRELRYKYRDIMEVMNRVQEFELIDGE